MHVELQRSVEPWRLKHDGSSRLLHSLVLGVETNSYIVNKPRRYLSYIYISGRRNKYPARQPTEAMPGPAANQGFNQIRRDTGIKEVRS